MTYEPLQEVADRIADRLAARYPTPLDTVLVVKKAALEVMRESGLRSDVELTRDLVKFRLCLNSDQYRSPAVTEMLKKTLGLNPNELPTPAMNYTRTVICRPSQFARFLIGRNDVGMRNGFKELDAVLFTPDVEGQSAPPVDVTKRYSHYEQVK